MRAVPGVHRVVVAQLRAHADGDRLLSGGEMDEAVHLVRARQAADPLLEGADPPHLAQQPFYAGTGASPTACWTAAAILAASGIR